MNKLGAIKLSKVQYEQNSVYSIIAELCDAQKNVYDYTLKKVILIIKKHRTHIPKRQNFINAYQIGTK